MVRHILGPDGTPVDVGTGWAHDVNSNGQVLCYYSVGEPVIRNTDGSIIKLLSGDFRSLNDAGHAAGWGTYSGGGTHPYFWSPETGRLDLGTLPGDTTAQAVAMNNLDQIAGESYVSPGERHPFIWTKDGGMVPLPLLPGGRNNASVKAINDKGQILGLGYPSATSWAVCDVLWQSDGTITDLGHIYAVDLNNKGQIITSGIPALVIDPDGETSELAPLPGTTRAVPVDINNHGSVLGYCTATDVRRIAVWDPVIPVVVADMVIEPGTLNPKSKGKWVTAYIELPADAEQTLQDIDLTSVKLQDSIAPAESPTSIGDHDGDGIPDLMLKFDRAALCAVLGTGTQTVKLAGQFADGTLIESECAVRVLGK